MRARKKRLMLFQVAVNLPNPEVIKRFVSPQKFKVTDLTIDDLY